MVLGGAAAEEGASVVVLVGPGVPVGAIVAAPGVGAIVAASVLRSGIFTVAVLSIVELLVEVKSKSLALSSSDSETVVVDEAAGP